MSLWEIWTGKTINEPKDRTLAIIKPDEQKEEKNKEKWTEFKKLTEPHRVDQNMHYGSPKSRREKGLRAYLNNSWKLFIFTERHESEFKKLNEFQVE